MSSTEDQTNAGAELTPEELSALVGLRNMPAAPPPTGNDDAAANDAGRDIVDPQLLKMAMGGASGKFVSAPSEPIPSIGARGPAPFQPPGAQLPGASTAETSLDLLDDVELDVRIELGRTEMYIEDVLRLGVDSVVELDKLAGDPVDIFVNDQLIARGEVLVLNDNFCVRINDIVNPTTGVAEEST